MSLIAALGALLLSAGAIALAVVLLRFRRKVLHVSRCAAAATHDQLERIYTLVEAIGTVDANGYVLGRTNKRTAEARCLVPVPKEWPSFPWAGRTVEVTASREVQLKFVDIPAVEPSLLGQVYRPVKVPRHQRKTTSKQRNTFSPERYLADSPKLRQALEVVCPRFPVELLSYLLCVGRASYEFEPIDQARIGTSPAWVQDPEHQHCQTCGRRMGLILQLPGTVVHKKAYRRGTFYLFGCASHPEQTSTLAQFT